jgi:hypothetical protein
MILESEFRCRGISDLVMVGSKSSTSLFHLLRACAAEVTDVRMNRSWS